jgi:hypothetical protein
MRVPSSSTGAALQPRAHVIAERLPIEDVRDAVPDAASLLVRVLGMDPLEGLRHTLVPRPRSLEVFGADRVTHDPGYLEATAPQRGRHGSLFRAEPNVQEGHVPTPKYHA